MENLLKELDFTLSTDSFLIDITVESKKFYSILTGYPKLDKVRSIAYNIFEIGCIELKKRNIRYE